MKAFILTIGLLMGICKLNAQINYGIAYYQVPAGWKVVQQLPDVIMEEQRSDGKTCRIILSATEPVVIDNPEIYVTNRQQKSTGSFSYTNPGKVVRKENPYCIAYISYTTEQNKNKNMKSSFFSFTNKKESFFVQFLAEDASSEAAFNNFIKTLEVEDATIEKPEPGSTKIKSKIGGKPRGRPRKNPA